jgi:GH24 family phage-related lysozyme (muramidase)
VITIAQIVQEQAPHTALFEGFSAVAYPDPKSGGEPWTWGYGHTGPDVRPGASISQVDALATLAVDLGSAAQRLAAELPWFLSGLDTVRAGVLTDIGFNVGVHGLLSWPVTLSLFRDNNWDGAYHALLTEGQWDEDVKTRAVALANATRNGAWT